MGNDFFGKRMVNSLSKKIPVVFFYTSLKDIRFQKKIKDVKIVHYIGSPTVSLHGVFTIIRLKISGKKIIMHWIGADSWMAQNLFFPKMVMKLNQLFIKALKRKAQLL